MIVHDSPLQRRLESTVTLSPWMSIVLASATIAGGLMFFVTGLALAFSVSTFTHPVAGAALLLVILGLAASFVWIGWRLLKIRSSSQNLLSDVARRRGSVFIGALALGEAVAGCAAGNLLFLLSAALGAALAWALFPRGRRA